MNRTFVQLAAILALLTFVLKLNSNGKPFETFIFSGLVFIGVIFIVLLGFYFIRTGISFMENNQGNKPPDNLEDHEESANPEDN